MAIGRRRFLALGAAGGAAAVLGTAQSVAAAPITIQVWRLNANWGYAVPPKGWTRCHCSACHNHAANKVYLTRDAAIDGRIHLCCVCQPVAIDLLAGDVPTLFDTDVVIDLRRPGVRDAFEAAVANVTSPTATPIAAPTSGTSAGVDQLPVTGMPIANLIAAGAGITLIGAGIAAAVQPRAQPTDD